MEMFGGYYRKRFLFKFIMQNTMHFTRIFVSICPVISVNAISIVLRHPKPRSVPVTGLIISNGNYI